MPTMRRLFALAFLSIGLIAVGGGCADRNAPSNAAHPEGWAVLHPTTAERDLESCTKCHGGDFRGSGPVVGCFSCHFDGPPFRRHPADWPDPHEDHQRFAQSWSWTRCANAVCHGPDLKGGGARNVQTGPSCFSASFEHDHVAGTACHAGGPPAPHALPFTPPQAHGQLAKGGQAFCQNCHGRPPTSFEGGFVATPEILDRPFGNCTTCHPAAKAHPTNWQGENDRDPTYVATHRGVTLEIMNQNCSVCHRTDGPGTSPVREAPSCFSGGFRNAEGISSGCHAQGPGTLPHALPFANPASHGPEALARIDFCQNCHGAPGTTRYDGGFAPTACSACHPTAGAHPTLWQGTNDADPTYAASHRKVTAAASRGCGICHAADPAQTSRHPVAPSCFSSGHRNGAGGATGCHANGPGALPFHPAGWEFDHVQITRVSSASCLAECHQDVPAATAGIPGCAACHLGGATTTTRIVHPDGSPVPFDFGRFPGEVLVTHQGYVVALARDASSCSLAYCHGADLTGGTPPRNRSWGVGPSCVLTACHGAEFPRRHLVP
jgi:hypothetical protein